MDPHRANHKATECGLSFSKWRGSLALYPLNKGQLAGRAIMIERPLIVVSVGAATDPFPYVQAVKASGAEASVMVPNGSPQSLPAQTRGIVFCGGAAVHPSRFGQELDPNIKKAVDEDRDAMEWSLLGEALERNLPIMGICRGFQMINVYLGGTLTQNLAAEGWHENHRPDAARNHLAHTVTARGGALGRNFGSEPFFVNSIHRQGIKALAPGLTTTATTQDGLIEGYECAERKILAVQWHPEELASISPHQALLAFWR